MSETTGAIIGIAIRPEAFAPMRPLEQAILESDGLAGDHAGNDPERIISILAIEDWSDALNALTPPKTPAALSWLARRANLLVEGVRLPRARGAILRIGDTQLEVTQETSPCIRMEQTQPGLVKALAPDWRGGVLCKVLKPGPIKIGDRAMIVSSTTEA